MRTPSFVSTSRVPSAFGVVTAPAGATRLRPAGDTVDPTCRNNTYNGQKFYDADHNCIDTRQNITGNVYNESGQSIDAYGVLTNGPMAPWATGGTSGGAAASMSYCGTGTSGAYVYDANGNQVPLPPGSVGCNQNGLPVDASGNVLSVPLASTPAPAAPPAVPVPTTPPATAALSAADQAKYNALTSAFNATGQIVSSELAAMNQQQLAQMQLATQQQIANMQLGVQQANAQGNLVLAQQRQAALIPMTQFQAQLNAQSSQQIALYVVGAIVALGIIGAVVYFNPAGSSQISRGTPPTSAPASSPRASRSRTARNNPFGVLTNPVHAIRFSRRRRSA